MISRKQWSKNVDNNAVVTDTRYYDTVQDQSNRKNKNTRRRKTIAIACLLGIAFVALVHYKFFNNSNDKTSYTTKSLLCNKNPYVFALKNSLSDIALLAEDWLANMDAHMLEAKKPEMLLHTHDRFFPFQPMSGCTQTCVGGPCGSDQSKIICGEEQLKKVRNRDCVVYSIGGNNKWQFEIDILKNTPCEVHTFDCTGSITRFQKPDSDRVTFHHICLGTSFKPGPIKNCTTEGRNSICGPIMTLGEIQSRLGHDQIDLLKFDIEGYEWPIFNSWPELSDVTSSAQFVYPMQILVEIHYRTQFPELRLPQQKAVDDFRSAEDLVMLQAHLLKMGYAVIFRDDNRHCKHCTELTLFRFQCL